MKKEINSRTADHAAVAAVLVLAALSLCWRLNRNAAPETEPAAGAPQAAAGSGKARSVSLGEPPPSSGDVAGGEDAGRDEDGEDDGSASGETPEERADREKVEAFDALVDKWREEESPDGVAMEKIDEFSQMFMGLPEKEKEDCLRRALNLVSDANFEVLAGLLVDRRTGDEFIQLIFDDMVNRSEEVKMTLLREIFKDKTHPCWAEAAWMLDAMDEVKPSKGN